MYKVSIDYGDGIGPEIMSASLDILKVAKAPFPTPQGSGCKNKINLSLM